jgi:hypothetical protein
MGGRIHKRQEKYRAMMSVFDEAERDKNGVTVEGTFDFDIIDPAVGAAGITLRAMLNVIIPQSKITLVAANLASAARRSIIPSPCVHMLLFPTIDAQLLIRLIGFRSPSRDLWVPWYTEGLRMYA